jgi:hypothetical protein
MRKEDIKEGDPVIYIPNHLLIGDKDKMIKTENLGIVRMINDTYVFVQYNGQQRTQATNAEDLYSLKNRPDLTGQIKF